MNEIGLNANSSKKGDRVMDRSNNSANIHKFIKN